MPQLFNLFLFFIILSLSISVILIHFSETSFSFTCFINWQAYLENMVKLLFHLFFQLLVLLILFVASSSFSHFILFILSICSFSIAFLCLSITISRFFISFRFSISLWLDIFIYVEKNSFCNNLHILWLEIFPSLFWITLLTRNSWIWNCGWWIWTCNSWIWIRNSWIQTRNSWIWTCNL